MIIVSILHRKKIFIVRKQILICAYECVGKRLWTFIPERIALLITLDNFAITYEKSKN